MPNLTTASVRHTREDLIALNHVHHCHRCLGILAYVYHVIWACRACGKTYCVGHL